MRAPAVRRPSPVRPPARAVALFVLLILTACSDFPEVAALEGPEAPPPPLLPLDGILPAAPVATDPSAALTGRADALRSRAGAIGAP